MRISLRLRLSLFVFCIAPLGILTADDGKVTVVQLAKAKEAANDGEVPAPGKRSQEDK